MYFSGAKVTLFRVSIHSIQRFSVSEGSGELKAVKCQSVLNKRQKRVMLISFFLQPAKRRLEWWGDPVEGMERERGFLNYDNRQAEPSFGTLLNSLQGAEQLLFANINICTYC
jgi:hypothetical protein